MVTNEIMTTIPIPFEAAAELQIMPTAPTTIAALTTKYLGEVMAPFTAMVGRRNIAIVTCPPATAVVIRHVMDRAKVTGP